MNIRMMSKSALCAVAAIAGAPTPGQSASVLCPPQDDVYTAAPGTWHTDYSGFLAGVTINSRPSGTVVSCQREIGQTTRFFDTSCHLDRGNSTNALKQSPDGINCTPSSKTQKTNDRQC